MAGDDRHMPARRGQGFGEIGEQLRRGRFVRPVGAVDKDKLRHPIEHYLMKLPLDASKEGMLLHQKSIFTEGNKGNEATDVGSSQISKHTRFLPLMANFQSRFVLFCSKHWIVASGLGDSSHLYVIFNWNVFCGEAHGLSSH
jgi:hypothetical protein